MPERPKLRAALTACLLALAAPAYPQITGGVELIPAPNTAGLTDLNDVILFRTANRGTQAFDGPLDSETYIVGPGDQIEVNIWSPRARSFGLVVSPEGSLLIPAVGELRIAGLTLAAAHRAIEQATREQFPASQVTSTLTQARRVRVHVAGLVTLPGTYELYASERLADALSAARGIDPKLGSARHVEVTRSPLRQSYDLLSYYARGDRSGNPYLQGGEFIRVPPREPAELHLQIAGGVRRSGYIEYREGDRASDLLEFGFGLDPRADLERILLTRTDATTGMRTTYRLTIDATDGGLQEDPILLRGDRIFVALRPTPGRTATVALYGEIARPGHYAVAEDSTTLYGLVEAAGGLTERASPHETVFLRPSYPSRPSEDTIPPLVSTRLDRLMAGDRAFDVPLKDRDSIYVPAQSLGIQLAGRVRRPGILAYAAGDPVKRYIERAGGYAADADKRGVRVIRAVSGAVDKPHNARPPEPGDQILVPPKMPVTLGRKLRDGLTFVSTLVTTYFVIREIAK